MTLNELKEKIAESNNYDWFQKYELLINYPHTLLSNYESNKINCFRGSLILLDDSILVKA